jgi:integrase
MRSYVGTPTTRSLLWFTTLTACRTGEARKSTWDEFTLDGEDPHWLIPAHRMKAKREHRVPLAPSVVTLLNELKAATGSNRFVFPHPKRDDRPASENAILYVLSAIGYKERMTGHGFRKVFSTLAHGSRLHDPEIVEAALAHGDEDVIRNAYDKSKRSEEHKALAELYGDARRRLVNWYADELERLEIGTPAKIVSIKQSVA